VFSLLIMVSLGLLVSQRQPGMLTRGLRQGVSLVISPFQKTSMAVVQRSRIFAQGLASLQGLRRQNAELRSQLEKLKLDNYLLAAAAKENDALRRDLEYKRQVPWQFIPADVIGRDPSSWMERAVVNRGTRDGVRVGAGVITPDGVVGRIIDANLYSATVMLLPDSQSSVAGQVARSSVAGTLKGLGLSGLRFMYVANEDDVKPGDTVVTSKLSTLFPPGMPLGEITSVNTSENGLMLDIRVKPRVSFKTLDRFLILKEEE